MKYISDVNRNSILPENILSPTESTDSGIQISMEQTTAVCISSVNFVEKFFF
jgi:hypothetical protein